MPSQKFVDIENSRYDDQRQVMEQIVAAGHCPFCLENLRQYHKQPFIKETPHWIVTHNQWPYQHTKYHFLLILKSHKENLSELDAEEGAELFEILKWLDENYDLPGGGLAMRFGDTDYSAGTVKHLHAQFIIPDIDDPDFKPTRFKIGKQWEKRGKKS